MGYWGWRPLVLFGFISVWVLGCSATPDSAPAPSPTQSPPVTLELRRAASVTPSVTPGLYSPATPQLTPTSEPTPLRYRVREGETLSDIAARFGIAEAQLRAANFDRRAVIRLVPGQRLLIPNPLYTIEGLPVTATPEPLAAQGPACYEQSDGGVLCLGEVENTQPQSVTRVIVRVQLLDRDGVPFHTQDAALPQRMVPAGDSAPYHALFPAGEAMPVTRYGGVVVTLLRAERLGLDAIPTLVIADDSAENEDGRYVVSAQVHNPGPRDVRAVRLVATLYDAAGRVTGYRSIESGELSAGETVAIRVAITPQMQSDDFTHQLHVEPAEW